MQTETSPLYKKRITGVFDRAAPTYGEASCGYYSTFAKKLLAGTQIAPGASVLDVATGRGALLQQAADIVGPRGTAVGVDISAAMVDATRRSLPLARYPQVQLRCMDAEHLDFPDATFDVVLCGFALFFLPDALTAIKGFHRVLKPSGQLALSTWRQRNPAVIALRLLGKELGATLPIEKDSSESSKHILDLVSAAGFCSVAVVEDELTTTYPSINAWLESLWSHGTRGILEQLTLENQECLQQRLREQLKPLLKEQKLSIVHPVAYTYGRKA